MKGRITLVILMLIWPSLVLARSKTSCDYTLLSNLKKMASNIDITYTYKIENDVAYFDVTLTNIQPDLYFVDNNYNKTYYYTDTNNGVMTIYNYNSGKISYSFYSNNQECINEQLNVRYINLPYYNKYYNYEECKGIEEYLLCNKWSKNNYGYIDFKEKTLEYRQQKEKKQNNQLITEEGNWFDRLVGFYLTYFYIFTPFFIFVILGMIYLVKYIKFKMNRFNI